MVHKCKSSLISQSNKMRADAGVLQVTTSENVLFKYFPLIFSIFSWRICK